MQVEDTLKERGTRYGDFTDNARVSQDFQIMIRSHPNYITLDHVKREALTVIMQKIARILNGDPNYRDNWHDIQGYAKLAEDRCSDI